MRTENLCEITNLIMLITNYDHEINLVVVLNRIDSYKVQDIHTKKYHVRLVLFVIIILILLYTLNCKPYSFISK